MSGVVFHAPFIHAHPHMELCGVWERTKNLAQEKYPQVKTYRSYEELLSDADIDLVVVNTPNITHYEYTKLALLAGKHVVVEKPFTATVRQAEELDALALSKGLQLSVYHNRRYDSDFRTVKKVLDEQLLGDIVDVEIHYDRFVPKLSYKVHKETPTEGVGSLYDLGSHLIDQALLLFGMPQRLWADIRSFRDGSEVDDYFDIKFFYPLHRVTLKSSYFVREALPAYQLHGKKGSFIKSRADMQEALLLAGESPLQSNWGLETESQWGYLHTEIDGQLIRQQVVSEIGNYGAYYEQMYRAIVDGATVPVTAQDGTAVIKIIEAAYESSKEQVVVVL